MGCVRAQNGGMAPLPRSLRGGFAAGCRVLENLTGSDCRNGSTGSPATKTDTNILERSANFPLFKVLLHNDDKNTMEHVVRTLMRVFRFGKELCERIMLEAHQNGVALCAVEPLEQAEHHRDQLRSFSLTATIEPE